MVPFHIHCLLVLLDTFVGGLFIWFDSFTLIAVCFDLFVSTYTNIR